MKSEKLSTVSTYHFKSSRKTFFLTFSRMNLVRKRKMFGDPINVYLFSTVSSYHFKSSRKTFFLKPLVGWIWSESKNVRGRHKCKHIFKLLTTTWPCHGFALDPTKYLLNIKVSNLVTTCWSLQGNANEFSVYVDLTYTGIPRISGPEIRGIQLQE